MIELSKEKRDPAKFRCSEVVCLFGISCSIASIHRDGMSPVCIGVRAIMDVALFASDPLSIDFIAAKEGPLPVPVSSFIIDQLSKYSSGVHVIPSCLEGIVF